VKRVTRVRVQLIVVDDDLAAEVAAYAIERTVMLDDLGPSTDVRVPGIAGELAERALEAVRA
jgi:hypothetical protein